MAAARGMSWAFTCARILGVGAFLPAFTLGHVRHLDAIAPQFLIAVAQAHLIAGRGRHSRERQGGVRVRRPQPSSPSGRSLSR